MILIPDDICVRLLANGAVECETDHVPVVKLFNPCGAAVWLITEMMADGDKLFGLCDLGFGSPELGYASFAEIEGIKNSLGSAWNAISIFLRVFRSRFTRRRRESRAASPRSIIYWRKPPPRSVNPLSHHPSCLPDP